MFNSLTKSGSQQAAEPDKSYFSPPPAVSLPKGGGAIKGMGEKFAANPVTGTGSVKVPIATSSGRSGFGPQLSLSYDSGAGNGPFGFGWSLSLPSITRKTDKSLPRYDDGTESDVFILSGAEDLVPVLVQNAQGEWGPESLPDRTVDGKTYAIKRYRPRIEGLFARIERWTNIADASDGHWCSISKDNILTLYGKDRNSRIFDPEEPRRIFSWLICETRDDKGNAVLYNYKPEDGVGVDLGLAHERNRGDRTDPRRTANRYLKNVYYGNRTALLDVTGHRPRFLTQAEIDSAGWMFEVVFDYGEHDADTPTPGGDSGDWDYRNDPFSTYRAGFEVRTTRLCQRVLMFHHIPDLPDGTEGYEGLVRSTDFTYSYEQNPNDVRAPIYSFLLSVTQSGYKRQGSGYLKRSLPTVEFEYSQPLVQDRVEEVDPASLENLPVGLDGSVYQWTDLHGEGIPGILTEQAGAWFYKRNLSPIGKHPVEFAPVELVANKPNLALSGGQAQFMDLAGDGQPDLVVMDGPMPGLCEHDGQERWQPFRPFTSRLNRDMGDPNLKFVDLDGDGHADVLITEQDALVWHPSLAEEGFGAAQRVAQALDEEKGPRLVFADGSQSIYLADLSGDGLTDLVRIRNGEVCYWPNLGYGRFGAKVTMDNAPHFDNPDQFDQKRIRLADIDGSGTTDIIYLHRNGVRLYFNQSGNSWSAAQPLQVFPHIDDLVSIVPTDLLGNGTACLVWSSPLLGDAGRQMRYVSLMGEQKPHLLIKTRNNLGAETVVHYTPSTRFYLQDKRDGNPWITRLPFPVHVVERVETYDRISRNHFVTRYAYHHGYFDGEEREFRGFGMVEQWDTEEFKALEGSGTPTSATNIDAASHVPPVHTKTWFHTGIYLDRDHISRQFEPEYYREPGLSNDEFRALLLSDTILPAGLTLEEEREACRALKGMMLHQEVYADDASPDSSEEIIQRARRPYTVIEQDFTIRPLQPRADNRHGVFFSHPREAITYHYERNPPDPRIQHAMTLAVDDYGNVLKEIAIGYGRRQPDAALPLQVDRDKQTQRLITYTENQVTNAIKDTVTYPDGRVVTYLDDYRTPLPCETRTYELTGFAPENNAARFSFEEWTCNSFASIASATEIPYEQTANNGSKQKRLIEHVRTLYRKDDLTAFLPLGWVEHLALTGEGYKLAFTSGLVAQVFQRNGQPLLPNPTSVLSGQGTDRGGYVDLDNNGHWWIPSGRVFYAPNSTDELSYARQHFFLPHRYRDPFHSNTTSTETFVSYDAYDLLMLETRDPLENRVTVGERDVAGNLIIQGNDYRVLQPRLLMDPNRNRTAVAFDTLGMVVGTAVMGKPLPAIVEGDSLAGFEADLTKAQIDGFYNASDPHVPAMPLLGNATTRIIYDLDRFWRTRQANPDDSSQWLPPYAATVARETHGNAPLPPGGLKVQISFSYSDGFGREIQKKIQAEPEKINGVVGPPRWVGSGWTIFNNKGKPVRQYEPFFSQLPIGQRHHFEFAAIVGVSPILFYDPVERVVATLHPSHTYEKVVFDPWQQVTFDVNDTVAVQGTETGDPRNDPDISSYVAEYFKTQPATWQTWYIQRQGGALGAQEQAAANKAAAHANTPTTAYFDTLGRPFLTVAQNRVVCPNHDLDGREDKFYTRVELDIEGNQRSVRDATTQAGDAQGRIVMGYDYDMLGNRIHQASMEAGERWMLNDVAGKPIRAWDSRGHTFRTEYDPLRRPVRTRVIGADPANPNQEALTERLVYGEQHPEAEARNLRGQVYLHLDQAGRVTSEAYDFKGNLLRSSHQLATEYKQTISWSTVDAAVPSIATTPFVPAVLEAALVPLVEAESFTGHTRFDALNRPIQTIATRSNQAGAKRNVIQPGYNGANLLERVDVWLDHPNDPGGLLDRAAVQPSPVGVENIDYDAKGQRLRIDYKNGATTRYTYDPDTFRLIHLYTRRGTTFTEDCGNDPPPPRFAAPDDPPQNTPCGLQNLHYTYDPVGNITDIRDDAQQRIFFRNQIVEPSAEYTYDAIYRLIQATGREHLGQVGGAPIPHSHNDVPRVGIDWSANDGNAMGTYIERYVYDAVGNFLEMQHRGSNPAQPGWTRSYTYNEASQFEPGKQSNRLTSTTIGTTTETYSTNGDGYDAHGNMLRMPQLQIMQWDYKDQLQMTQRQRVNDADVDGVAKQGERTYYVHDAAGQRVRKVTELANGNLKDERIYLGGFEVYRQHSGTHAGLERESLHVMDDKQRIALVETRNNVDDGTSKQLIRYQFGNHLGSVSLELDEQSQIVSYEEFTPYGSTSYQAVRSQTETPKRYRYTGKERDEESGLYYHGARYYVAWLGRWTKIDSAILKLFETRDELNNSRKLSLNPYEGMANNPITFIDPDGQQTTAYERYLDRELSTPEGASRVTGIPYTPPPPLTVREQEAVDAGTRLGAAYGQFEADLNEFNNLLNRRWSGVSLWDRLPEAERSRITRNVIEAYNRLPQLTEHFEDPSVSSYAQSAFNRARQDTYSTASWGNRIRGFFLDIAPFLAAGLIAGLISGLRRAGARIVIDLFGGARSQIPGAINVDIAATSGIRADVMRGLPISSGVADEVIVTNPFLRGAAPGSTAANTWLSEAARILRPGGRITVTGNLARNRFTRVPTTEELERLGLRLVEGPRPVSDPRIIAQRMFTTDGRPIDVSTLQSYILERIR
jgi:RHS repeat-associated protein